MRKQRKHYSPDEKVAILRRHLLEEEPISELCDELKLQPMVFYRWQKELFENGAAFEQKARTELLSQPDSSRASRLTHRARGIGRAGAET